MSKYKNKSDSNPITTFFKLASSRNLILVISRKKETSTVGAVLIISENPEMNGFDSIITNWWILDNCADFSVLVYKGKDKADINLKRERQDNLIIKIKINTGGTINTNSGTQYRIKMIYILNEY